MTAELQVKKKPSFSVTLTLCPGDTAPWPLLRNLAESYNGNSVLSSWDQAFRATWGMCSHVQELHSSHTPSLRHLETPGLAARIFPADHGTPVQFNRARTDMALQIPTRCLWAPEVECLQNFREWSAAIQSSPKKLMEIYMTATATWVRLQSFLRGRDRDEGQLLSSPKTSEPEHYLGNINQGAMLASVSFQTKKCLWSS